MSRSDVFPADLAASRYPVPVTPWQRGFEDARYAHIYANPYRVGSDAWWEYDRGFQHAVRQAKREERQHG
ncbi:MAG: hypothetical protein KatS3mg051_1038 [Anaerolineae bacterium]|nr:MAG: hypothetical protein KatS3mg051_1038 [Anaerolineae bacterium]